MHLFWTIVFLFALPTSLFASQAQNYGLGGPSSGRVGSVAAETDNPFAAIYNPALSAAQEKSLFGLSTGFAEAAYDTLSQVRVKSAHHASDYGAVQDYRVPKTHLSLWAIGCSLPFRAPLLDNRRAGFGLVASGPYDKLRSFSAATPDDFYTLRYGTSDAQFKGTFSLALELLKDQLFVGAGLSLYITTAGVVDMAVVSTNPTGRMALDVQFNSAAVAGFFFKKDRLQLGLVYRQKIDPSFRQLFNGRVQVENQDVLAQPVLVESSLYYEPETVEAEVQHNFRILKASIGLAYQAWRDYKPSFLMAETIGSDSVVRRTQSSSLAMRNVLSPRVSATVPVGSMVDVAAGYQFRPSPVADISGPSNPLDSDVHVVGLSIQHHLPAWGWLPLGMSWGLYGQYHWMPERPVVKSDAASVGAPGFRVSGRAYNYGVFLQGQL